MRGLSFERLVAGFIEEQQARVYGKRKGLVTNVDDPESMGRIRAQVPGIMHEQDIPWALPCAPFTGPDAGLFVVPPVGAAVWIEYEEGDINLPIWSGGWWPRKAAPKPVEGSTGKQTTKVLKSDSGLHIALDDDSKTVVISDDQGSNKITIQKQNGKIEIKSGQKVVVEAPQIELVDGATHPLAFGDDLLTYLNSLVTTFNAHTHPGETAIGIPISPAPPVSLQKPPTPDMLSNKVRTG